MTVAVVYGGKSPEHEVAIITALQAMQNLDSSKFDVIPIYVSKSGQWIKGGAKFLKPETYKDLDQLTNSGSILVDPQGKLASTNALSLVKSLPEIDVYFPIFHGQYGEDGTLQGLLDLMNVPYVGCGVLASALGMDKVVQKEAYLAAKIPQVKYEWIYNHQVQGYSPKNLHYPLFVKPANGGSSIGTSKVKTPAELKDALEVAGIYDRKIVIEESAEGFKEINISVLGNSGSELQTSVCEQPVASSEVLTYADKYESSKSSAKSAGMASAKRLIPAPIKAATAAKIATYAKMAFQTLDASGVSRIDFLVSADEKTIYLNEINTIPGSLSFYLWEKTNLPYPQLLEQLIDLALQRHSIRQKLTHTFSTNILANLGETLSTGKLKG